jgi:hypothetical protein
LNYKKTDLSLELLVGQFEFGVLHGGFAAVYFKKTQDISGFEKSHGRGIDLVEYHVAVFLFAYFLSANQTGKHERIQVSATVHVYDNIFFTIFNQRVDRIDEIVGLFE